MNARKDYKAIKKVIRTLNSINEKKKIKIDDLSLNEEHIIVGYRRDHLSQNSLELELSNCFLEMEEKYWEIPNDYYKLLATYKCSIETRHDFISSQTRIIFKDSFVVLK